MNFPGSNTLTLTDAALMDAVEGALNASRRDGEDYIHVTEIGREGYGYGYWKLTITTDAPKPAEVTELREVTA